MTRLGKFMCKVSPSIKKISNQLLGNNMLKMYIFILFVGFNVLFFTGCEDKNHEPSYCSIHGDIVWTLNVGDEEYAIAWTTEDDKADFRMKWSQDEEKLKLPGYWHNATLAKPPGATLLRNVTLSPDQADFFVRNTTLNDLPAGCK